MPPLLPIPWVGEGRGGVGQGEGVVNGLIPEGD